MQILVTDPKGVQSIYDMDNDRLGKNIKFMRGWTLEEIREYCENKKWKMEILSPTPDFSEYYGE